MREATLSRYLFGIPVLLGGGVAVWLLAAQPGQSSDSKSSCELPAGPTRARAAPHGETFAQLRRRVRRRIARLGNRLPQSLFIVEAPPFLVIGDEPPARIRYHVQANIIWAERHLKRLFFARNPRPLEVWLASDPARYRKITKALFGGPPGTPYGFYVGDKRIMVMNIQTGGGTLVHELVHAYMEANFPNCPPWFNEGLGSLYEMVGEKSGRIWGFVNWRLPPLQQAISEGRTLPFAKLGALTQRQFYKDNTAVHYGQSRYLLYYLQMQGKLVAYYRRIRQNIRTDPTGANTLIEILGKPNLETFRRRWETWIMQLRYTPHAIITPTDAAVKTWDPTWDPAPTVP